MEFLWKMIPQDPLLWTSKFPFPSNGRKRCYLWHIGYWKSSAKARKQKKDMFFSGGLPRRIANSMGNSRNSHFRLSTLWTTYTSPTFFGIFGKGLKNSPENWLLYLEVLFFFALKLLWWIWFWAIGWPLEAPKGGMWVGKIWCYMNWIWTGNPVWKGLK